MSLADSRQLFRQELLRGHLLEQQLSENTVAQYDQAYLLREAIFLSSYVAVERLLESSFMAYAQGQSTLSGVAPVRYLFPISEQHAYDMVKSSQPFLDWTSPDTIIKRCETYFENGDPLKSIVAAHMELLRHAKRIRNYLTHRSRESENDLSKTMNALLPTPPLIPIKRCGEFLSLVPTTGPARRVRILKYFLNGLSDFGEQVVS